MPRMLSLPDTPKPHIFMQKGAKLLYSSPTSPDLDQAPNHQTKACLAKLCEVFDHYDEEKHKRELRNGAAEVLSQKLAKAKNHDEIRMICAALEMVFRTSSSSEITNVFGKLPSDAVPTYLSILSKGERNEIKHPDVCILNITRVLVTFSKIPGLHSRLCRIPGMLEMLSRVTNGTLHTDARIARTRVISHLSSCEENKILMYESHGLLDSVLRLAHLDTNDSVRQYASAVLMDLAGAPYNQPSMAKNERVIGTVVKMAVMEKSSSTRESALASIQSLAFCKDNRGHLVSYRQGVVLEALKKAITSDADERCRRHAAGALTNLSCEDTAKAMANHKGLLQALAVASSSDDNLDVQSRAALALTKIASSISFHEESHDDILDALVVASLSKVHNGVITLLRIKARDPDNREKMALHSGVLDTLADVCVSNVSGLKDKDNAVRALMHLVNENKNRKLMCSALILDALVEAARFNEVDLEEARDSAIIALERLATEVSNRHRMARHPRLLESVAQAVEREAKWEDSGRKSEHGFLAKPLLLSLLLAM